MDALYIASFIFGAIVNPRNRTAINGRFFRVSDGLAQNDFFVCEWHMSLLRAAKAVEDYEEAAAYKAAILARGRQLRWIDIVAIRVAAKKGKARRLKIAADRRKIQRHAAVSSAVSRLSNV